MHKNMKKRYITPSMELIPNPLTLLQGTGPRGGDSSLPQVNEEEPEVESTLILPHLWDPDEVYD